ncbi:MAG: transcriptional repressor [Spirochaetales bacterium]
MKNIGYRNSRQRKRILELLRSTTVHPTAAWIYDQLKVEFPNLSLGTVYRNLRILQEQGEITHLDFGSTFDRFDGRRDTHYHFICDSCGKIIDVSLPIFQELEKKAAKQIGGNIYRHRLEFFGLCPDCKTKNAIKGQGKSEKLEAKLET